MANGCLQLFLLLRKNFILKTRRFRSTCCELFFPVFFFAILIMIRHFATVDNVQTIVFSEATRVTDDIPSFLRDTACGKSNSVFGDSNRYPYQSVGFAPNDPSQAQVVSDLVCALNTTLLNFVDANYEQMKSIVCLNQCGNLECTLPLVIDTRPFIANTLFTIFDSPAAMDGYYEQDEYGRENSINTLAMGLIINGVFPNWDYTVRLNNTDAPPMQQAVNNLIVGYDNTTWMTYIDDHVVTLKWLVDQYVISTGVHNTTGRACNASTTVMGGIPVEVSFVPFPVPAHQQDNFSSYVQNIVGFFLAAAFMWPFSRMVRFMVDEKEKKIKEGLKMMGMRNYVFWLSWGITYLILFTLAVLIAVGLAKPSVFPHSDFSVLFVFFFSYCLSLISLACLISSFFTRAKTAGTLSPFVLLLFYLPYFAVSSSTKATGQKNLACLLSPVAVSLGAVNILDFEGAFQGVRWTNLSELDQNFALGSAIGIMLVDFVLYLLAAIYFDLVAPSEFGTQLKWYFPVQPSFWMHCFGCARHTKRLDDGEVALLRTAGGGAASDDPDDPTGKHHPIDPANIEPVPEEVRGLPGIHIRRLRKTWDKFVAVDCLDLDIYQGQIFCLLGHNGAGKTTTINMLTGMLPVTSGTAQILDQDITEDMEAIRQRIGICPQQDVLFDDLTVKEHLQLFARLKDVPANAVEEAVRQSIAEVQLQEQTNQESLTLSGGQKRRLCLAIALIGDSKVVFLDEPTSGVDPFSRRAIWDLLAHKKKDRVVVLTTHFMDEADQLGDRIAILHKGKLRTCGSGLFLKWKFGVGYNMTFTKTSHMRDADGRLAEVMRTHVSEADVLTEVGAETVFRLPLGASEKFPALLRQLDRERERLGVAHYALSVTTLEEVFLKVAADVDPTTHGSEAAQHKTLVRKLSERRSGGGDDESLLPDATVKGLAHLEATHHGDDNGGGSGGAHFLRHLFALLRKRWNISKRDKQAGCCQILLPLILLTVGFGLLRIPPDYDFPTLVLDPTTQFDNPNYMPVNTGFDSTITGGLAGQPQLQYQYSNATNLEDFSLFILNSRYKEAQSRYGGFWSDATFAAGKHAYTVYNNITAIHGLPTFMNMANAALLRNLTQNPSAGITTRIHPFSWTATERQFINTVNGVFAAIVICFGFSFIPASYAVFIVAEREQNCKHLQQISGVSLVSYWVSNYIWDFVSYLIPALIGCGILAAYGNPSFTGANFPYVLLVFVFYGLSVIPFTYCCSFLFKSYSTAQNVMIMVYIFCGVILTMVDSALSIIPSTKSANQAYIRHIFRLCPSYCLGDAIFYMAGRSFFFEGPLDLNITGYDLIFMGVEAVVFFAATLMIDVVWSTPWLMRHFSRDPVLLDRQEEEDEDVTEERERLRRGDGAEDVIRLKGLRKTFAPNKMVTRNLWFGVHEGECFGFLGINGAGKSTVMKILTGEQVPTAGEAWLGGFNVATQPNKVRQVMGYCPQFHALHELLTGRETLEFYGRLRGIPPKALAAMVDALIDRLTLQEYQHRTAGTYSGGNKRKLSVAVALIGSPRVVLLDEPSTGMDPVSRRFMWEFISETMATRAVILTTHSMEECEALCQRIAILASGGLRCIGTSQHLKTRYGEGFQLDVSTSSAQAAENTKQFILTHFPHAQEMEAFAGKMKFHISNTVQMAEEAKKAVTLVDIFTLIEAHKQPLGITEYAVGQPTLEQIFIRFAKEAEAKTHQSPMPSGSSNGFPPGAPSPAPFRPPPGFTPRRDAPTTPFSRDPNSGAGYQTSGRAENSSRSINSPSGAKTQKSYDSFNS